MKKKLLAIVLSVVMLASLLVPMFVISAADGPAATISLGTPVILEGRDFDEDGVVEAEKLLGIPVLVSDNNDEFFTARYQVLSENGLNPYFASGFVDEDGNPYDDEGFDEGNFTKKVGKNWISFINTVKQTPEGTDKKGFQVLHDSDGGTKGISAAEGTLITVYFEFPTAPGTYTFTLVWLDGTDEVSTQYTMTVNPATTIYTVACTSHTEVKDDVNSTPAKCGVPGEDVFKCSACGKELRRAPVAALQHEWVKDDAASTPAECDVPGEDVFNCTQPGCPIGTKRERVDALGHLWDNGTVATNVACGSTADIHYECTRDGCDAFKDETGAVVPHNFVRDPANDVAAKCGTPGSEAYKCDRPNCPGGADSTKTVPTAALEHNWVKDDAASTAPICGTAGEDVFNCTQPGCPVGTKRVPVAALEHNYKVNNAESYAATCITPGLTVKECDQPGCPAARIEEPINATGVHVYDNGTKLDRVCGQKSAIRYECICDENCTHFKVEEGAVIEHDWEYSEALSVEPKCGVPGKDVYVCKNANCPVGTDEHPIDALEHDYDYYYYDVMEVVTPPTKDAMGTAKVPCYNGCGETKNVDLEKLATKIEGNGATISSEDAILPEDVDISINKGDEKDGKVEVEFVFASNIIDDLEGDITYALDISEAKKEFTNFKVYKVNADGSRTLVSEIKGDELVVAANLKDTLVITYEEIPENDGKSPVTSDSMNVVILSVFALVAMAGLAVVCKKRFAL